MKSREERTDRDWSHITWVQDAKHESEWTGHRNGTTLFRIESHGHAPVVLVSMLPGQSHNLVKHTIAAAKVAADNLFYDWAHMMGLAIKAEGTPAHDGR